MRLLTAFIVILASISLNAQQASLRILTQETWPPGKNVPVTIEIERGEADGFARFYHDLPQGFMVENVINSGADFFRDNTQINYVWLDLPDEEIIIIQYLARADELLAGSFKISGRFDYILEGKERVSVEVESVSIKLDRTSEVESFELPEGYIVKEVSTEQVETKEQVINPVEELEEVPEESKVKSPEVSFRVQVSISSQRFSQDELEERVGSKLKHGIKVLKTGNMFKYQSGSFEDYDSAADYLRELKANGVADAFIVAFSKGTQISINEARELTER